jgi:ribonuclease E
VHAQVPVEVASFLLNEKRPEIAKIELKQRTHVLLIPNKGLETPNYKLERLKHDDPRLDSIQASYKMAEEIEDPTAVTRRSQEPTNRQTPVIKGVLPDMPAPAAEPRPARPPSQTAQAPAASSAPAEKGFFGWLKDLFGGDSKPAAPATEKTATRAKPADRNEGRGSRGAQDGRRGGRRGEGRGERTDRAERPERADKPENRSERPEGRSGRGGRGDRQERPRQEPRLDETVVAETPNPSTDNADSNTGDRPARQGRERSDGRRGRGRRGERAPAGSADNTTVSQDSPDAQATAASGHMFNDALPAAEHTPSPAVTEQTQERRERRGRERPGRERQARSSQGSEAQDLQMQVEPHALTLSHPTQAHEAAGQSAASSAQTTASTAISMPKVAAYDLPLAQLHEVAQTSGLQWVNSNPERIAQIQAAIAAEPRPVHVPRERAAPVVLDEGPLILVETKRDLGQLPMPFENT